MAIELGRRLIAAGVVAPGEIEAALFLSVVRGQPFTRVLLDRGAITERALEEELDRVGGLAIRQVIAAPELVARVPIGMCRRLAAIPVRIEPLTGVVDVAAADPLDPHVASELAFHLGTPVRVLRAPISAIEEAIRRLELEVPESDDKGVTRNRRATPPFPHGAPQSSIPPPQPEEAPIPLVRRAASRASLAEIDAPKLDEGETIAEDAILTNRHPPRIDDEPTEVAMSLSRAKLVELSRRSDAPPPPQRPSSRPPPDPAPALRAAAQEAAFSAPRPRSAVLRRSAEELPSVRFPSQPPSDALSIAAPEHAAEGRLRALSPDALSIPKAPPLPRADLKPPPSRRNTPRPMLVADIPQRSGPASVLADAIAPLQNGASHDDGATVPEDQRVRAVLRGEPIPSEAPPPEHRRIRPIDAGAIFDQLDAATTRDEVVKAALKGMRLAAKRVALFAVKREGFYGWACSVDLADPEAFRAVVVPADAPSAFATAAAAGHYLGPIRSSPAHDALLSAVEHLSDDVAIAAATVKNRPAMMLFADDLYDSMLGTRFLEELAKGVGEALSRLLAK